MTWGVLYSQLKSGATQLFLRMECNLIHNGYFRKKKRKIHITENNDPQTMEVNALLL